MAAGGEEAAGGVAAGVVVVGVTAGALFGAGCVCAVVAGAGESDLDFSVLRRNNTGGPSSSFMPRGIEGTGFFTALTLTSLAVCQVPSAIHFIPLFGSLACNAPVTVNSPRETPVRTAS